MPYKKHEPDKPTAYLDTSTLSYASNGLALAPSPPEARRLLEWVNHVAHDANVVISLFHVEELARWAPSQADPCVEWLWSLPLVPARMFAYVLDEEDEHWLAKAMGFANPPAATLFAPTLLTSLEKMSVEGAIEGLQYSALPAIVGLERENLSEKSRDVGRGLLQRFIDDADEIRRSGASDERVKKRIGQNFRSALRRRAVAAHCRLSAQVSDYRALNLTEGGVQDPFVELYESDPKSLPMTRVIEMFSSGFADTSRRSGGGKKRQAKVASAPVDYMHMAVGAAYCEIFTCDVETSEWLGTTRQGLGLPDQIAFGGEVSFAEFVGLLERAFP